MSIEFGRKKHPVAFVLLHPGTVATDLSAPFRRNVPEGKLFSVERAASQLLGIIGKKRLADSGTFMDWQDETIVW